ncbi:variable large family protein, partial [Escherichia coli]|uniref:variable large family protein n=1 Tax=Escherichia coli TaxID=562 RepID=UPI000A7D04E9
AAGEAATKGGDAGGGADKIGDAANNQGAKADESSVNGIAKGIKGIVDAAGKAFGKDGNALKDVAKVAAENDDDNKDAGKLFATGAAGAAVGDIVAKAAGAVTAVSGEQILKAIVDAAGGAANQAGKKADAAKNPIAAAIGTNDAGAAFSENGMKKSDNIAAAIVLRGVAAAADDNKASVKSAVESAVGEVSAWLEE